MKRKGMMAGGSKNRKKKAGLDASINAKRATSSLIGGNSNNR